MMVTCFQLNSLLLRFIVAIIADPLYYQCCDLRNGVAPANYCCYCLFDLFSLKCLLEEQLKEATTVTIESPFVDLNVLQGDLIKLFKLKEFLSSVPQLVDMGKSVFDDVLI